ncbi:MAG TPA: hypothetical protein VFV99_29570 [Kofleriaceae bacterium]|nr:hypothetical protein [Kofleriaceae bacterium]
MYEAISDADLVHVVGGCVCQPQQPTDPNAGGTTGAGAPPAGPTQPSGAPAPGAGGQPSSCDQLLQAITQLLNLFGGMNGAGAPGTAPGTAPGMAPKQPTAGAQ